MLTETRILEIFQNSGALLTGHFRLQSGRHSDRWLQSAVVLQYPEYAAVLCAEMAARVRIDAVDVVIGAAVDGIILAYEVAKALKARALFGRKKGVQMRLPPGFRIEPRERIVVVDDVLTTGDAVFKLIDLSRRCRGQVVTTAFLIDGSSGPIDFGVPTVSLSKIAVPTYLPDVCPMCQEGIPLVEL